MPVSTPSRKDLINRSIRVLSDNEKFESYSNLSADSHIKDAGLSRLDSALASALIYGVLQRKLTLQWVIKSVCDKGVVELFEGDYLERAADYIEKELSI